MGFFTEFSQWLDATLANYIANNTATIAGLLEPAIVSLGTLYVAIWGYLQLSGKIDQPFVEGARRLLTLALILGVAIHLWLYNTVIVDTFFNAPNALAAGVVGAPTSAGVVDQLFFEGSDAASLLLKKGGVFNGDISYYLAGFAVYLIVGLVAIYTMFLLALSKIALSILIALGPLFIGLLFFESTKRFMGAWIAQLANYAFVTILTVLAAALMLQVVTAAATQAATAGGSITIGNAAQVCAAAGLTFLIMKQVPSIAAGLASGVSLSSFGAISSVIAWGLGRARGTGRQLGQFGRGLVLDRETKHYDTLSRKAGYQAQRGIRTLARRENTLRAGARG
jgi:type IV secretion system protein VirB6